MKMTGRNFLEDMRDVEKLIEQVREQIKKEENTLMDIAVHYKDVQVQEGTAKNKMYEKVPEIIELMEKMERYIKELENKKSKAFDILKKMDPKRQRLIIIYFMNGNTVEKTAEEMERSYTWTWWELQEAIKDFERIMEE